MAWQPLYDEDHRLVRGEYLRHLRTLTFGSGCDSSANMDLDVYRLRDGGLVEAESPSNDGRAIPVITRRLAEA